MQFKIVCKYGLRASEKSIFKKFPDKILQMRDLKNTNGKIYWMYEGWLICCEPRIEGGTQGCSF